jgi:DNA-directed RNA polymerase subunit M/transcription elongation factor TFIIS
LNLLDKIKKNIIQPYDLAFIDNYKLFPEKWQEIIDEKSKTEQMIKESIQETATDLFQCPRCNQRKTIYCEVQIRSSDEPMTKFITCINCGKKWKQG